MEQTKISKYVVEVRLANFYPEMIFWDFFPEFEPSYLGSIGFYRLLASGTMTRSYKRSVDKLAIDRSHPFEEPSPRMRFFDQLLCTTTSLDVIDDRSHYYHTI